MSIKSIAKRALGILPEQHKASIIAFYRRLKAYRYLLSGYAYDFSTYCNGSGYLSPQTKGALEANLIRSYHRIEKGLALPEPRPGFGGVEIQLLIANTGEYARRFGSDATVGIVLRCLNEYVRYSELHHLDVTSLKSQISQLEKTCSQLPASDVGGTKRVTRAGIAKDAMIDFQSFSGSRYSVRQFSAEPVPMDVVTHAVKMAQKTPSVCNRQSGCVFVVSDREKMNQMLAHQNGNRGFNHQINKLLIVTSRLDTFLTFEERNQAWVDGGMFAMSLIYALHSLGVGSCCLNWDVTPRTDKKLKSISGIPHGHAIIMMLAIGRLPDEFVVAQSPRRSVDEVLLHLG